jgi:HSP20 family molecular chaperone IbpA
MARHFPFTFEEFQRTFDELFDTLLIEHWHAASPAKFGAAAAAPRDLGDRYEVRLEVGYIDADRVDIEAIEQRLRVRYPNETRGVAERSFSFIEPVDCTAVTAHLSGDALIVVLPKKGRTKRIRVSGS